MNKGAIHWLHGELPGLIASGVLSDETADRLRERYPLPPGGDSGGKRSLGLVVTGVLGAVSIGLGIILLVAYNWEFLGRPGRTAVAFMPLLAGQAAAGYTLFRRRESAGWREASAIFLVCAVAIAIALIGQTYHIPGNLEGFLFTCMLLSLPLVYLLNAGLVAVLYTVALPIWAGMRLSEHHTALVFYPMAVLVVPYIVHSFAEHGNGLRSINLALFGSVAFFIGLGIALANVLESAWVLVFPALFTMYYLLHTVYDSGSAPRWTWPFRLVGAAGLVGFALVMTYDASWRAIHREFSLTMNADSTLEGLAAWAVIVVLFGAAVALSLRAAAKGRMWVLAAGAIPLLTVATLVYFFVLSSSWLPILLFNAGLLVLGGSAVACGIHENRLLVMNWGILVLAAVIMARFLDAEVSMLMRGVAFIVLGAALLTANLLWLRRKRPVNGVAA